MRSSMNNEEQLANKKSVIRQIYKQFSNVRKRELTELQEPTHREPSNFDEDMHSPPKEHDDDVAFKGKKTGLITTKLLTPNHSKNDVFSIDEQMLIKEVDFTSTVSEPKESQDSRIIITQQSEGPSFTQSVKLNKSQN